MAPALWERYPTPDAARCEELFGLEDLPTRRAATPRSTPPRARWCTPRAA
jgi:hypothetical protein